MLEQAREHSEVRRLTTIPGIGPVRAAYIVAIVVTPFRFSTKRDFFGYCGLGIVTRSSSDYERDERSQRWVRRQVTQTRGLNRNRNPLLKAIFKGAALSVIAQTDHPLRRDYDRLLQNSKPPLARLTIARRIASATLAIWKKKEEYDPAKHCTTDTKQLVATRALGADGANARRRLPKTSRTSTHAPTGPLYAQRRSPCEVVRPRSIY